MLQFITHIMSSSRPYRRAVWIPVWVFLIAAVPAAQAQSDPAVRIVVRGDSAFVYHTELLPPGYGVNLYRISSAGDTTLVTPEPILSSQTGNEFAVATADRFEALRNNLQADSAFEVYMRLRGDRTLGLLTSFAYPEVARAFGRLVVDEDAPLGEIVTYRFEVVDDFAEPTGAVFEGGGRLAEVRPPVPNRLEAEHEGNDITLSWQYPTTREDDTIIRFIVYRANGGLIPLSDDIILLRNAAESSYDYSFAVPTVGATETFYVAAVSVTGQEYLSEPLEYFVEDNVPPAAPAGVHAFANHQDATVELTWRVSPEPDVAGYHVYRAPRLEAEFVRITAEPLDVLETVYLDTTTVGRRTYFYQVTAFDESGNVSEATNPVMIQVDDLVPPPPPSDLHAEFREEDGAVHLTWTTGVIPADFDSYIILRRQLDGRRLVGFEQVNSETVRRGSYLDAGKVDESAGARNGFSEGAFYRYGVVAADSARNFSDTVFVDLQIPDLTPPPPPANLVAVNDGGLRAIVRWTASDAGDVTEYALHRRLEGGSYEKVSRLPASTLVVQDDSVRAGETYYYAATAIDSLGNESERSTEAMLQMRDFDPPPAVRNVQAYRSGQDLIVRWERSPVSDIAGYVVYRSDLATGTYERVNANIITGTETTLPFSDDKPFYQVRAVDSSGNESRASRPVRLMVPTGER